MSSPLPYIEKGNALVDVLEHPPTPPEAGTVEPSIHQASSKLPPSPDPGKGPMWESAGRDANQALGSVQGRELSTLAPVTLGARSFLFGVGVGAVHYAL